MVDAAEILNEFAGARIRLIGKHPFIGTVAASLVPVVVKSTPGALAAVDNRGRIYIGPEFVEKTNVRDREERLTQRTFVIFHETLHVALQHIERGRGRNSQVWQIAADLFTNDQVKAAGLKYMPEGLLYDLNLSRGPGRRLLAVEEIYARLMEMGLGEVSGNLMDQHIIAGDGNKFETMNGDSIPDGLSHEQIQQAVAQARIVAGRLPGDLEDFVDGIVSPKIDWRRQLQRFVMDSKARAEVRWKERDIILSHIGFYIPDYRSESLDGIVFGVDTSGSKSNKDIQRDVGEVLSVLGRFQARNVHLVQFDTRVQKHDVVDSLRGKMLLKRGYNVYGRGGTDFRPLFDYIREKGIRPQVVVVLTDGWGIYPEVGPGYPVIWVLNHGPEYDYEVPGFGHVMRMV